MTDYMIVNGNKYNLVTNFKDINTIRDSFNTLTQKIYGFNFEQWYQDGYWQESYIPYCLMDQDRIVANVSVNVMDFSVLGKVKRYIQIGTVMTDTEYRGLGLSRALMERILYDWKDKCEFIYLFANKSVLNFYPKFGFSQVDEFQYIKSLLKTETETALSIRKLEMSDRKDRDLLIHIVRNRVPFSKITMINNTSLVMFYCTSFMINNIYYIQEYDVVVIAEYDKNTLSVLDVFSAKIISLDIIINALLTNETTKVRLGFTPEDESSYEKNQLIEEDTTLFIKANNEGFLNNAMFPILSHA